MYGRVDIRGACGAIAIRLWRVGSRERMEAKSESLIGLRKVELSPSSRTPQSGGCRGIVNPASTCRRGCTDNLQSA